MDRGYDTGPLDSDALLRAAAAAGHEVSRRQLETFRAQGLVPRPYRSGYRGRAPVWTYPDGADQQLAALLAWREHTKDINVLRVLLWLDGFAVPLGMVRGALADALQSMLDLIEREITTQARQYRLDPDDVAERRQALGHMARVLASKRGPRSLPRRSRVSAGERAHAVELLLRMIALGERIEATPEEADAVERVLGVTPNGRRHRIADADPWLTGPAESIFDVGDLLALPAARTVMDSATDAELETARGVVAVLFQYLPILATMLEVMFDQENYAGIGGLATLQQNPHIVVLMVPLILGMIRAGWQDNLDAITTALSSYPGLLTQAERVLDMSASAVEANLQSAPAEVQQRARRVISAMIDGSFDQPVNPGTRRPTGS